jgi:hypothetical protein
MGQDKDYFNKKQHPLFDTLELAGEAFNVILTSREPHAMYIYKRSLFQVFPNHRNISKKSYVSRRIPDQLYCDKKIVDFILSSAPVEKKKKG